MKTIFSLLILFSFSSTWAWSVESVGCRSNHYADQNIVTYTRIDIAVGPDARAVLNQTTRLENGPPNVGLGLTENEKFGFFMDRRKINPDQTPLAALFGTPRYDGFLIDNGTIYTRRGSAKPARAVVTFTKRYGDGEPHTARVEIFTRESIQMDWAITETLNDCYLSVIH